MIDVVACCDLCKKPLDAPPVELRKWTLHPDCATVVKARLERFAHIIFDMTDEEFEAWMKDEPPGEWRRGGQPVEYKVE